MATVPVISSHVLRGLPGFVRSEMGEQALRRANRAAGFDVELFEDRNCFIPQQAMVDFVDAMGHAAGEPNLGLLLAPTMNVADYGSFGQYMLSADTLGEAIRRSIATLRYHSTYDRLSVVTTPDHGRFSHASAIAGADGYAAIATAAAGELFSVFRAYLPEGWRPLRIELDIERPRSTGPFEDVFQCPVLFEAPAVTIVAERRHLGATGKRTVRQTVTMGDVIRDRPGGAPRSLLGIVMEQVRARILTGELSIDDVARSMGTSVRTLQRELHGAGTDFRSLANTIRARRGAELLRDTTRSITDIAAELGYASPAGFARAFRKVTGLAPREFRTRDSG